MKPVPFKYTQASTWKDAVSLLGEYGEDAKLLAGGQTLVPAMNFRLARPNALIDLNTISNSAYTKTTDTHICIGGLARHIQFDVPLTDGPLREFLPRVSRHIAHVPIRMRGTFAGSLAHADPASEWCALIVSLDGTIVAEGSFGEREIEAKEFFVSALTTSLTNNEVIREVRLPLLDEGWFCGFQEFSRRAGDFALAIVIAHLKINQGVIEAARICIGGVGVVPFRAASAESELVGHSPNSGIFTRAGEAASILADPIEDPHATGSYRCDLVKTLVPRALSEASTLAGLKI
ncbi:MAG: FAD binding domain-containing protein [Pseudomonadota bacterium]|nr:FAD binding domain-containing protein [Pseudomonadota bacterium]